MRINLKKLVIVNFKGLKNILIPLSHITNIYGENAAGKTTIFDAFTWLMFGKDSSDKEKFNIKPLDQENKTNPKTEVEVVGYFEVDGDEVILKKTLRENWVKPKGAVESVLKGNDTQYYWNDVPVRMADYEKKVGEILNEGIFKLITNPFYFNNNLKWQERRAVLMEIAGKIEDRSVIDSMATLQNKDEIFNLTNVINTLQKQKKSIREYREELSMKKRKLKDELKAIPTRIDEANRNCPQPIDFVQLNADITAKQEEIAGLEEALMDVSKAQQNNLQQETNTRNQIHELKTKLQNLEFEARSKLNEQRSQRQIKINSVENEIRVLKSSAIQAGNTYTRLLQEKETLSQQREQLIEKWHLVNNETIDFDAHEFVCPTCKREFEQDDIDSRKSEMESNFNQDKTKRLQEITFKGQGIKTQIEAIDLKLSELDTNSNDQKVKELEHELSLLKQEHEKLNKNEEHTVTTSLKSTAAYFTTQKQITDLEATLNKPKETNFENTLELKSRKQLLQQELDALKSKLSIKDQIERTNQRVGELQQEESKLAQELADIEGLEFSMEQFAKAKIDTLESRLNGRLKYVKFRMFTQTMEGNDVECCDTLINGVPFQDANNAAKINAGLDIINTLCQHYNAYAPIFIDNRESVNNLIDCDSQIVNLIVSTDKELRIAA